LTPRHFFNQGIFLKVKDKDLTPRHFFPVIPDWGNKDLKQGTIRAILRQLGIAINDGLVKSQQLTFVKK
jgi:hypothetical protein